MRSREVLNVKEVTTRMNGESRRKCEEESEVEKATVERKETGNVDRTDVEVYSIVDCK